jgi:hypothetical protein
VVERRINTDEQSNDVRMSRPGALVRVPRNPSADERYRRATLRLHLSVSRGRPVCIRERVLGFKAIADVCGVHERTLIEGRDSDPYVRSLIRKVGGRYYVLTKDLIELDLALHSRRVEGKRAGATKKARAGRGRFAPRHQTS